MVSQFSVIIILLFYVPNSGVVMKTSEQIVSDMDDRTLLCILFQPGLSTHFSANDKKCAKDELEKREVKIIDPWKSL
jgi:hypothetical protein